MADKMEIKKKIAKAKREIKSLEQKRLRSQGNLLEALVDKKEPSKSDVDYFKTLSSLIRLQRESLHLLEEELKEQE
ncbi:MAG: hypothetical protein K2K48_00825 [Anaeroplasmataceae bacterium]|nr:hypothetical protein [Anaeroplasmataceae bacterium]